MSETSEKVPVPLVRLFGTPDADTLAEAGSAFHGLVQAVTDEVAPDSGLKWKLSGWERQCDTCGWTVPMSEDASLPPGWTNDGRYDFCERCTVECA